MSPNSAYRCVTQRCHSPYPGWGTQVNLGSNIKYTSKICLSLLIQRYVAEDPINGASSSVDDEKTAVTRSARQVKKPARFHLIEPQVHSQNERKFVRHQLEKRDHMSEGRVLTAAKR